MSDGTADRLACRQTSSTIPGVPLRARTPPWLDLTSSDFPDFDRNHSSCRAFGSTREMVAASQPHPRSGACLSHDLADGSKSVPRSCGRERCCRGGERATDWL